jgi:uncharacterized small protein (DUF1192 family)
MESNQNLCELKFEVQQRGGRYILVAQDFGVVVRAQELSSGVAELQERISAISQEFAQLGIPLRGSSAAMAATPSNQSLKQVAAESAVRAGIAAAVIGVFLLAVLVPALQFAFGARQAINSLFPYGTNVEGIGRSTIDAIGRLANATDQITPEREKELQESLRRISRKVIPLIEAARGNAPGTPPAANPRGP